MSDRRLERLKWRSRRGLLELDLFFTRFWDSGTVLSDEDMDTLDRLLQLSDNDLLDMVMSRQTCDDAAMQAMIERLRQS